MFHIGTTGATARCMVDEFREKRFMHETVNYHKTYSSGDLFVSNGRTNSHSSLTVLLRITPSLLPHSESDSHSSALLANSNMKQTEIL